MGSLTKSSPLDRRYQELTVSARRMVAVEVVSEGISGKVW